jgi:hypothetical protein
MSLTCCSWLAESGRGVCDFDGSRESVVGNCDEEDVVAIEAIFKRVD